LLIAICCESTSLHAIDRAGLTIGGPTPTQDGGPCPPLSSALFLPIPLPFEVGPLNSARKSGERCKLPQRGLAEIDFGAF